MMKKKLVIILGIWLQAAGLTSCHTEKRSPEDAFLANVEAVVRSAEKIETAEDIPEYLDIYEAFLSKASDAYGWGEGGAAWLEASETLQEVAENSRLRMSEEQLAKLAALKERFAKAERRFEKIYENYDPSLTDEEEDNPYEVVTRPEEEEEEEEEATDNEEEEDW